MYSATKEQKKLTYARCIRPQYHMYEASTWLFYKQLIPMLLIFVNYFYAVQNQYMLFWLLKDAYLTCKRRPLRPLLTPF